MTDKRNNNNFLIFAHNYIGDTLMLTPAIRALKSKFSESKIIVVVSGGASPILKRNSDIWKVVEMKKVRGIFGIFGVLSIFLRLRKLKSEELGIKKFYICVNFLRSFKFAVIGFLLSERQIGESKRLNNFFFHDKIELDKGLHNIDKSLKFAELFYGEHKHLSRSCIYEACAGDIKNAENILKDSFKNGDENFKTVLFAPGSTRKSKEANPKTFSLFADYLNSIGYRVVITGAKKDVHLSKKIFNNINNKNFCIDLTGLTDIYILGGLIKISSLVVSVDNGTMHLSSAIKTPLIALFGSTDPAVCGPVSGDSYVIDKKKECYHCFKADCPRESFNKNGFPDCMGFIVLDDLIKGTERLLK